MIAVDTSVVVAGFASWHDAHGPAVRVLSRAPRIPAHVALETFSVLTRLPPPHRTAPSLVAEFLDQRFGDDPLTLDGKAQVELVARAARRGISGGAVYDALVGATAASAGATLLTLDRRAVRTYERFEVTYELIA